MGHENWIVSLPYPAERADGILHPHGIEKCILNNAFSGLSFAVQDITAEGERVVVKFKATGLQVAEYQGVPPTGTEVVFNGVATFGVKNNQIAEASGSLSPGA